ncbi:MAG: succinate dehydrogenase/fumarate reductase iron-sulfur subunit [bacterium]|nr:succinate dehydrogenase/fumarate reductase iron-sulfur subunit [bacterium]
MKIWRQEGPEAQGSFKEYEASGITPEMSFFEMLDELNAQLAERGERPVEFDSDCREGICGTCGLFINGLAHGGKGMTTCMLRMHFFDPSETITVEPFRAAAFPVVRDLITDKSALDRLISAYGYISANTGSAPDANITPVSKEDSARAMDAAACIGCGACVASCPNSSAQLFASAKIAHLARLPQGRVEAERRVKAMAEQLDKEKFGSCSNYGECAAACPRGIKLGSIAVMRREYIKALLKDIFC